MFKEMGPKHLWRRKLGLGIQNKQGFLPAVLAWICDLWEGGELMLLLVVN